MNIVNFFHLEFCICEEGSFCECIVHIMWYAGPIASVKLGALWYLGSCNQKPVSTWKLSFPQDVSRGRFCVHFNPLL